MAAERKLVPVAQLRDFLAALFERSGLSAADAGTVAETMVWADLRGVDSHGVSRAPRYVEMLASGEANPRAAVRVERPRPGVVLVHADAAPGPVAMSLAMREAVATARHSGVAWAAVHGTVHTGAIGRYAEIAAEAGMIGLVIVAGMPNMAYTGAKGAAVATSPLAIAVPSARHGTVLLDMATATIALGRIAQHRVRGIPLPEGAALTAEGEPTTDPAAATMPTPLGGAKGSGLSLAFELLTSVLAGNPIVAPFHAQASGGRRHKQNAAVIAVDIAAFRELPGFLESVDDTLDALQALPRQDAGTKVLFPGQRGQDSARARAETGISVPPKLWAQLESAAAQLNVALP